MKPGTIFKLSNRLARWKAEHAIEVHQKPQSGVITDASGFMLDYNSHREGAPIYGVILEPNRGLDSCDLVWLTNEHGDSIEFIERKDIEVIYG